MIGRGRAALETAFGGNRMARITTGIPIIRSPHEPHCEALTPRSIWLAFATISFSCIPS